MLKSNVKCDQEDEEARGGRPEGASLLCQDPSPSSLSSPSKLSESPGLELKRPPQSHGSWALTLLLGSHKLTKVSKSKHMSLSEWLLWAGLLIRILPALSALILNNVLSSSLQREN